MPAQKRAVNGAFRRRRPAKGENVSGVRRRTRQRLSGGQPPLPSASKTSLQGFEPHLPYLASMDYRERVTIDPLVCDGKPYVRWPVAPFPDLADDSFTELKDVEQFFAS